MAFQDQSSGESNDICLGKRKLTEGQGGNRKELGASNKKPGVFACKFCGKIFCWDPSTCEESWLWEHLYQECKTSPFYRTNARRGKKARTKATAKGKAKKKNKDLVACDEPGLYACKYCDKIFCWDPSTGKESCLGKHLCQECEKSPFYGTNGEGAEKGFTFPTKATNEEKCKKKKVVVCDEPGLYECKYCDKVFCWDPSTDNDSCLETHLCEECITSPFFGIYDDI